MSDLYVHHPVRLGAEQARNLITLARYLVTNAAEIEASGFDFGDVHLEEDGRKPPAGGALTPLGYGPRAGIAPMESEDWRAYCRRAFGIEPADPFSYWLQSSNWARTEPSATGVALRIAYVLDYGVPGDQAAISRGEAYTDYDSNGFLWDRLDMTPVLGADGNFVPLRLWPAPPRGG